MSLRLKAWWNGQDVTVRSKAASSESARPPHLAAAGYEVRYAPGKPGWETDRIELFQQIWGEGFSVPGGAVCVREAVNPFGLNESMSVLELGCGLGGAARTLAEEFGAWVTGLESDPYLRVAGAKISEMQGLTKKAEILAVDPADYEPPQRGFDHMISRERLYALPGREAFLRRLLPALKPKGQLALTDFVLAGEGGEAASITPPIAAWMAAEGVIEAPSTARGYATLLEKMQIEVRVNEDVTERYRGLANQGWATFLEGSPGDHWQGQRAAVLAAEVERWRLLGKALDSGALRVCRINGLAQK